MDKPKPRDGRQLPEARSTFGGDHEATRSWNSNRGGATLVSKHRSRPSERESQGRRRFPQLPRASDHVQRAYIYSLAYQLSGTSSSVT